MISAGPLSSCSIRFFRSSIKRVNRCNIMTVEGVWKYPVLKRDEKVLETHFGRTVKDPYRWLEDPDSAETRSFVEAENAVFQKYIAKFEHKEAFKRNITEMYNYERFGTPFQRGGRYFYFYNSGLQPQSVLYTLKSLDDKEPQVFFDPNKLSADGTVALSTYSFTDDGSLFAYALASNGSDWVTIHVKKTAEILSRGADSATELESKAIEWAKFTGIEWTKDKRGFTYMRYPKPDALSNDKAGTETDSNTNAMLYYHVLGTSQEEDILLHSDPQNPSHMFGAEITDDGRYLILTTSASCDPKNKIWVAKLAATGDGSFGISPSQNLEFTKLVNEFDSEYNFLANDGSVFYFKTSRDNSLRYKIVSCDVNTGVFTDVIAEDDKAVLQSVRIVHGSHLLTVYLEDVKHTVRHYDLATGKPLEPFNLPLPNGSIVESMTGRRQDTATFYKFVSFVNPGTIYHYDFASPTASVEYKKTLVPGLSLLEPNLKVEQVFFTSKDGTRVPMYVVSLASCPRDGSNPTLLYGYGGFNISVLPTFSPTWISFISHFKGVVAVANIRGGGEYGEHWYRMGRQENKQNVFDDFQAAARCLVDLRFTSSSKLAINGGSNGGLLVGACVNQAPELFGCAIADVGVMDVLRFHKFTIGHAWTSDYGDPNKESDFLTALKYSPLHNVQTQKPYPAVLLTTSDHDDRVVPLHSYKLIATLQHAAKDNPAPLMIRVETKAGHGAGKPLSKRIEEAAEKFSFMALSLNAQYYE